MKNENGLRQQAIEDASTGYSGSTLVTFATIPPPATTSSPMVQISHADVNRVLCLRSTVAGPYTSRASYSYMDGYIASFNQPWVMNCGVSFYMTVI